MKPPRRTFLHLAAGAAALPVVSRFAGAQTYPTRPVRIVVAFPPGGANDIHARMIGQWLHERLGQPFLVENRPGSGGNLGVEAVVRSPADGYTLLILTVAHSVNKSVYEKLSYDLLRDIAPVAALFRAQYLMMVNPRTPAKTVPEFIAYVKANPGKINFGSNGVGATGHLAGELFKMMTGVNMLHVPYRGETPALTDLVAGQVHVVFASMTGSLELVRGGQLRALAVTSTGRTARRSAARRVRPRLRAPHLVRRRRAQEHADGDCRPAEQGDRRLPCDACDAGQIRRSGLDRACGLAGGVRQVHRRGHREVGEDR